ncbi:MAG: Cleavage polyadenylation factor subunit clp1 [Alyxoria varia]|nr:MAG: Cleavage polyadenylation factor subunit clp1 [Alyxoria varia]
MALPGLTLSAPVTNEPEREPSEPREIELCPGSEWRFEVSFDSTITVTLLPTTNTTSTPVLGDNDESPKGTAELFGTELAPTHPYTFSGAKAAIHTHHGCALRVSGDQCESDYIADETPLHQYMNLHFALENLRETAAANVARSKAERSGQAGGLYVKGGPRVLVLGPQNAGKTSLIRTLSGYATRMSRSPCIVNLDPREGMLALPGSLSAAVMGHGSVMDLEDVAGGGWGPSPVVGPSSIPVKMPLVYHYGFERPEECPEVFKPVVTRLALAVTSRLEEDEKVKEAGLLVDMAGSLATSKGGYDIIHHVISELSINVVVVLGSERLFSDLSRRYPTPKADTASSTPESVHVLKVMRSEGCVDRDAAYMKAIQHAQIRQYFFGTPETLPLNPYTQVMDISSLTILRMVDPNQDYLAAFLPGDAASSDDSGKNMFRPTTLNTVAASNHLLAIKHAPPYSPKDDTAPGTLSENELATIRDAPLLGYLYIADVDEEKGKVKILSPVGGRLPARAIVWGRWPEGLEDLVR